VGGADAVDVVSGMAVIKIPIGATNWKIIRLDSQKMLF
jgi:hypothetical protein